MPPIVLSNITPRQKLVIANGLNTYKFIKDTYPTRSQDFKDVFTDFYLSSQGVMRNEENQIPFFNKMYSIGTNKNLVDLVNELRNELPVGKYEFSFSTKLLHTVNNDSPIYDSKVRKYLKNDCGVDLWLMYRNGIERIDLIRHDWELLVGWYRNFLASPTGRSWIDWFDTQFPAFAYINDVKKVDFIIFACSGY